MSESFEASLRDLFDAGHSRSIALSPNHYSTVPMSGGWSLMHTGSTVRVEESYHAIGGSFLINEILQVSSVLRTGTVMARLTL